jgi:cytochrome P450
MGSTYLTLHRSPDRRAYYETAAAEPVFDPVTKAWIVKNPAACERILNSPDVRPDNFAENYAVLEKHLGLDFSNTKAALRYIPLCLHAEDHVKTRRLIAAHLAAEKDRLSAWVTNNLPSHLKVLEQEGEIELVRDVLEPLVFDVMEIVTDVPAPVARRCKTTSVLFDKASGPRKRQRAEAEVAQLHDIIRSKLGPDASDDAVGVRLALAVVGRDSFLGTLGASLHHVLTANQGRRLDEIDYPPTPPETGVPFVERIAVQSFEDVDTRFKTGDRIRLYLQSFAYTGSVRDRARIFGQGSHLCPGKSLSLAVWGAITKRLAQIPLHADVTSYAVRTDDYVFLCADHLNMRLRK